MEGSGTRERCEIISWREKSKSSQKTGLHLGVGTCRCSLHIGGRAMEDGGFEMSLGNVARLPLIYRNKQKTVFSRDWRLRLTAADSNRWPQTVRWCTKVSRTLRRSSTQSFPQSRKPYSPARRQLNQMQDASYKSRINKETGISVCPKIGI